MAESSSIDDTSDGSHYPTTDNFDQNIAKRLSKECSTVIIEGIPVGTQFGIDLNVYNIGPKFLGIKFISSGLHFIHYNSVSKEGTIGPRIGFFRYFKDKELIVRKWNNYDEDVEECNDFERLERYNESLNNGSIDRYLGSYQFSTYTVWVGLTDYITESLFNRLNPKSGKIQSVTQLISISGNKFNKSEVKTDSDGLPVMKTEPNSVINFIEIPNRFLYPSNSNASEISRHSLDASYTLESILTKYEQIIDILGELQFAFITFMFGQVFDSFEFWKQLLKILCMSENAVTKYTDLYLNFVRVLHFQLKQTPTDYFADIVDNNNFLVTFLTNFFSNIKSNPNVNPMLRKRGQRFEQYLTKEFKWDFNTELEDEAPTLVDL